MNPVLLFQNQHGASTITGDACLQQHFVYIPDFTVAYEIGSPVALKVEELLVTHKFSPLNSDNPVFQRDRRLRISNHGSGFGNAAISVEILAQ